jgi:hypothetical protein
MARLYFQYYKEIEISLQSVVQVVELNHRTGKRLMKYR